MKLEKSDAVIDIQDEMNWDNIRTIAEFDVGLPQNTTFPPISQSGSGGGISPTLTCIDQHNFPEPLTSNSLLIQSLIQLLCHILESDSKLSTECYRAICEELHKIHLIDSSYLKNEFEQIRSQYQMQIYKIICATKGQEIPISLPFEHKTQEIESCWSRYRREFDEMGFIAAGAFGKVYRARNKLDSIEYAIKQIKIPSSTIKLRDLAEVKTMACLNHPNIVQYKAAWLESYFSESSETNMVMSNSGDYKKYTSQEEFSTEEDSFDENVNHSTIQNDNGKTDFSEIVNNRKELEQNNSSEFIIFHESKSSNAASENCSSFSSKLNKKALLKYAVNSFEMSVQTKEKPAILYIQMALCQLNLKHWLTERNSSTSFKAFYLKFFKTFKVGINHLNIVGDIFYQLLSGLNYLHSRYFVHHDIKPGNIFVGLDNDHKLLIQLGDFGLSCPLQNHHKKSAIGTPPYAAPEQLRGHCNPKSDLYSLGIVLLELLLKFNTSMQLNRTIEDIRKCSLPAELNVLPQYSKVISSLLGNEDLRPHASELLEVVKSVLLKQKVLQFDSKKIRELQIRQRKNYKKISSQDNELEEKNNLISGLQQQLKNADMEIRKLKEQLKL